MQKTGLEWLWRIKEEPQLWRRYAHDASVLLRLLLTRILPLVILTRWEAFRAGRQQNVMVTRSEDDKTVTLTIKGAATARTIDVPLAHARYAADSGKDVVINFSETRHVDARFLGLLLMLDKKLNAEKRRLTFTGISAGVGRIFRLNGFGHLRES
jgi:N-acetylglucosaminyldiphosphoundecaprenol N-acetyl-beta-D-mannosaminyltransferase